MRQVLPKRDNPYNNKVEKRAAHDARTYTKVNTVRSHHKWAASTPTRVGPLRRRRGQNFILK